MTKLEFKQKVFLLTEQLYPMVRRMLGNHANTEDALQEIMLKLWLKRKQIAKHPNIRALVFLIARNYCIDFLRKNKLEMALINPQMQALVPDKNGEQMEYKDLQTIIYRIVEKLPQQQKEVLLLRDLDGYQCSEIAAAMQLKTTYVRVLLSRARKQVRIELEKNYSYESRPSRKAN